MSVTQNQNQNNKDRFELLRALKQKPMLIVTLLGFSSGLPIMIVYASIKLWLKREGVDVSTLGYLSWIALPYSYNFLWAFFFDRYKPFARLLNAGRRKSWLMLTQFGLILSLIALSFGDPNESVGYIAFAGTLLCFMAASQDVAVDAYRNEILDESELGIGASLGVYGYRIGMWVASGFGIWVTDASTWNMSFQQMFLMMAGFACLGPLTTFFADEPEALPAQKELQTLKDSVIEPFMEYLKRPGAWIFLGLIFFYKFGDSFAGSMSRPFYVEIGFSNKTIGEIASTVGLFSSLLGLFVGGGVIYRFGYFYSLLFAGVLQGLSTFFFSVLSLYPTKEMFTFVVFFEDFSSGIGSAALIALMGSLTNKSFTATQYALFASLAAVGRTLFAGFAGDVIKMFSELKLLSLTTNGYLEFYTLSAFLAIPGIWLLILLKRRGLLAS